MSSRAPEAGSVRISGRLNELTRKHHNDSVVVEYWSTTSFHPPLGEPCSHFICGGQKSEFGGDSLCLTLLENLLNLMYIVWMNPDVCSASSNHLQTRFLTGGSNHRDTHSLVTLTFLGTPDSYPICRRQGFLSRFQRGMLQTLT